jgi:glycerol 2-dehydrogenase (NADP+)
MWTFRKTANNSPARLSPSIPATKSQQLDLEHGNPLPTKLRKPLNGLSAPAIVRLSPVSPNLSAPHFHSHNQNPQLTSFPGHIDTALAYGNESEVGLGIKNSGVPRSEIWLTTKLDNPWHKRVAEGIDSSLKSLGVDYVDLYLMHWPSSTDPSDLNKAYPDWDYVDTWREMQKLVGTGKVRNIGVSNFGITHLERLLNDPSCKIVPAVNQIELHPNNPSPKLVAYNTSKGIHSTGYSCLGSTASPLHTDETLAELAKKKGRTPQQVMLVWGIQKGRSVIPKSVTKERIEANFDIDGFELSEEEIKVIDNMKGRFKVCGDSWLPEGVRVFFGDDE